jgi:hypothetical protein
MTNLLAHINNWLYDERGQINLGGSSLLVAIALVANIIVCIVIVWVNVDVSEQK